jgi:glycosyltransferase involved in cell wall biosynthesis
MLIEAFARIATDFPQWTLLLAGRVGQAPVWAEAQRTIAENRLQERVSRVEGLSHQEIAELMRRSEVFVLPSQFEGLGLSLQEALFHGCACVSTDSGGPQDLLDGTNGLLVPKDNVSLLAAALARILGDDILRLRLQRAAPQSVRDRQMSAAEMAEAYRLLYEEVLQR